MNRYARIIDDVVVEVVDLPGDIALASVFPPELGFESVSASVEAGMVRSGGDFAFPDDPGLSAGELLAYAADKRWRMETGGIELAGVPVATDDRSKIMIMGARVAAVANPEWQTVWHGADGGSYPLGAASMIQISDAVEAHVNATFAKFAQVKAGIEAGAIGSVNDVDAAFSAS